MRASLAPKKRREGSHREYNRHRLGHQYGCWPNRLCLSGKHIDRQEGTVMVCKPLMSLISATSLVLALEVLESGPVMHAQAVSIAAVTGRVTDEQGASVAGARIQIRGVDTGTVYNALSNADGIYTIPNLPIGAHTLQAAVPGFQTYVQTGIVLRVGDNVQINITMKVGAVAEKV